LWPGRRFGIPTHTALGKAAVGALGLSTALTLAWKLRFYKHVYVGQGEELTFGRLVRNIHSRIPITATDRPWQAS
jgi:hypothetical protein